MAPWSPVSRRLLLTRIGSGVFGTFLLPGALHQAMAQAASSTAPTPSEAAFGAALARPAPQQSKALAPLVMLDPGHGGKDPGAIGVSGTYEKHVSLAAALELKRQLATGGHYRVELTRTRDIFVPLDDRVAYAQARGAALFVSMHADALNDHTVRGASVYTLATAASDAQTAALARRENSADRFAGPAWHGASPEVARILGSLVRQETRRDSGRLAHDLVGSLDQELPMLPNPARHAGFVVLKAADIPSVLVEMGFMSNPGDETLLRQAAHRTLVARAMKRAVDGYFATAGRPVAAG
jgi:N-acetylmuramoyl-L-alanine amidase